MIITISVEVTIGNLYKKIDKCCQGKKEKWKNITMCLRGKKEK